MTLFDDMTMEIEFTAGVWTDVTADCRLPVEIKHGRPTPYDDVGPASMTFTLNDPDGDYRPNNTLSPHYPNVIKGVRCRWTVTKASVDRVRFVGWVQRWKPSWPSSGDYAKGIVQVQATDGLGLLGQRKLRSNFTETILWRARLDAVASDAWEAVGQTSGLTAYCTNFSSDAAKGAAFAATNATLPTLSFGSDDDLSCGGVVSNQESLYANTSIMSFQANHLTLFVHVKLPAKQITLPAGISRLNIGSFHTSVSGGASLCHLALDQNSINNGFVLRNAADSSNLAVFATTAPYGQWVRMEARSRTDNAARSDWAMIRSDGGGATANDLAIDVRTIRSFEAPGALTGKPEAAFGGVAGFATRTGIDWEDSWSAAAGRTIATRAGHLANAVGSLPVTVSQVGTLTGTVATGRWSGRSAAEVLREIARSHSGLVWARPRDSAVYVIGSNLVRPSTPIATVSLQDDCIGPPVLEDATDTQPTRIDVSWPGGTMTAIDAAAEADGERRSIQLSTVCADTTTALAAGTAALAIRSAGLRISKVTVDLCGAVTDHTTAFFTTSSTLEGLYPSARVRFAPPLVLFGNPSVDAHVEGWIEKYTGPGVVTVELDTSPAVPQTLASQTWTGSNGAAWPAQLSTTFGAAVSGSTVDIQSNRGRIIPGAGNQSGRRFTLTAQDVEITGLVQVQGTAEAQVWWRGDSTLANGYGLVFSASDGVRVQQRVSGGVSTRYPTFGPAISVSTDYRFRIRHMGEFLSIRAWAASGSEPGTWQVNASDTLFTAAGYVGVAQWYTAQTALFDDLVVTSGD